MNVLVVFGGRNFGRVPGDIPFLFSMLDGLRETIGPFTLIHGGADGADKLAQSWAESRGVPSREFKADWNNLDGVPASKIRQHRNGVKYNVAAGFERNQRMIDEGKPTHGAAFRGGNGTIDMFARCMRVDIPLFDFREVRK